MQVDPLAENSISMTAYHYAAGNPIRNIDPDGMDWVDNNPQGGKSVVNYKGVDNMRSNFETVTIKGDLGGAAERIAAEGLSGIGALKWLGTKAEETSPELTGGETHQRGRTYDYDKNKGKWKERAIFQVYGGIYGQTNAEPSAGVAFATAGAEFSANLLNLMGNYANLAPVSRTEDLIILAAKGGSKILSTITRVGRDGNAIEIFFKNGNKMDINAARVKEWVPNLHPKAPKGTLSKVKFDDYLPGSKGYKRSPTSSEIDLLNSFFK
jgi:hypothetical protein